MSLKEKLDQVLELQWDDEEKKVLVEVLDSIYYFRRFISKKFEEQVVKSIDICIKYKKIVDAD